MRPSLHLRRLCAFALMCSPALMQAARQGTVSRVALISADPFQLQIQTNGTEAAQTQMVSSPERLVVDIPNTLPGPALRGIAVKSGEVRGVRVSLFSTTPPVTRIVVDLNEPQWYRVTPNGTGLLVSLGSDSQNVIDAQSTIGWVSTKLAVARGSNTSAPAQVRNVNVELRKKNPTPSTPARKGLSIEFSDGLMTIHSGGATLSEILFQIQKVTGAEIAIPSGTEQDKVAADFGPGTPSEVLGELLNGTGLNFVVVGSEANPNILRSVILTRQSEVAQAPSGFAPNANPAMAEETEAYQEAPPPDPNMVLPPPDPNPQPDQGPQPGQQPTQQPGAVPGDPSPDPPQPQ